MKNAATITRLQLRLYMAERGLTCVRVAGLLNVRPQTVRCWVSGVRGAPPDVVKQIKAALRAERAPKPDPSYLAA